MLEVWEIISRGKTYKDKFCLKFITIQEFYILDIGIDNSLLILWQAFQVIGDTILVHYTVEIAVMFSPFPAPPPFANCKFR